MLGSGLSPPVRAVRVNVRTYGLISTTRRVTPIGISPHRALNTAVFFESTTKCRAAPNDKEGGPDVTIPAPANPEAQQPDVGTEEGTTQQAVAASATAPENDAAAAYPGGPSASDNKVAGAAFLAAAIAWFAVGGALAGASLAAPELLLRQPTPLARVLLLLLSATAVRMAGALSFLKTSADDSDLHGLRATHLNTVLGIAAAGLCVTQLLAAPSAMLAMTGVLTLVSAATVLACGWVSWRVVASGGVVILGPPPQLPRQWLFYLGTALGQHIMTALGVLYLVIAWTAAAGALNMMFSGTPPVAMSWAEHQLRSAVGFGFAVLASSASTGLDYAKTRLEVPLAEVPRRVMLRHMLSSHPLARLAAPNALRFAFLNFTLLLSFAIQAVAIWWAPEVGIDLNADAAIWAPVCWSTVLGLLWTLTWITRFNWGDMLFTAGSMFRAVMDIVYAVATRTIMRRDWATDWRSR